MASDRCTRCHCLQQCGGPIGRGAVGKTYRSIFGASVVDIYRFIGVVSVCVLVWSIKDIFSMRTIGLRVGAPNYNPKGINKFISGPYPNF